MHVCSTPFDLINFSTICYQNISKHMEVVARSKITPKTNEGDITTKERKQELSFLH